MNEFHLTARSSHKGKYLVSQHHSHAGRLIADFLLDSENLIKNECGLSVNDKQTVATANLT